MDHYFFLKGTVITIRQIVYNATTKVATIQVDGDAVPVGSTLLLDDIHDARHTAATRMAGIPGIDVLTLCKKGTSNIKELEALVCNVPAWSKGMPLAAKGFICERYKKD